MTAGIKRMLAEKAKAEEKLAAERAWQANSIAISNRQVADEIQEMIRKAAPYMDENTPAGEWPPSKKLTIAWAIGATGTIGPRKADIWALRMIQTSRDRFVAGLDPNPWLGRPNRASPEQSSSPTN